MRHFENTAPLSATEERIIAPISIGEVVSRQSPGRDGLPYFAYVPRSAKPGAPLFLCVHGITRNAAEQAIRFRDIAETYGAVLVAPLFTTTAHRMYQQFGASVRGPRSDKALLTVIEDIAQLTSCDGARVHLFGFSGGAQFAHRFAMAYPDKVSRLVIAAAGWYTLPTQKRPFPWGLRARSHIADLTFDPDQFLRIPTKVLVGSRDSLRDESLRQSPRLDKTQGRTRIDRARRWVNRMNKQAADRGLLQVFEFEFLVGGGHSFSQCMNECGLGEAVGSFLFGGNGAPATKTGDTP
jgi:pimeloyl-ACP methyl ester carboxylesterase